MVRNSDGCRLGGDQSLLAGSVARRRWRYKSRADESAGLQFSRRGLILAGRCHYTLMKSILELIADIPTNAALRLQAAALEKKIAELEAANADLKKRVGQLESELSAKTRLEEFVEHHGALFKRKPGGGYHAAVYCPHCKQSVGSLHALPYDCSCGWSADFNHFDLEKVMQDLPQP